MSEETKKVLVLRTNDKNNQAHGGFQWPESGMVEAPDWSPEPVCGKGLHGLLWGSGDYSLLKRDADAIWQVLEVDANLIVDLNSKVKFPRCEIIYSGNSAGALAVLRGAKWGMEETTANGGNVRSSTNGNRVHSSTNGNSAHSSTNGNSAHSSTNGNYAHSSTNGENAHSCTNGHYAHSSTNGDYAHSCTNGENAHLCTNGHYAHSCSNGDYAHSSTNGDYAHSSTNGDYAHSSTNGDYAHSCSNGDYAHSCSNGDYAHSSTNGENAIAAKLGVGGKVKAGIGGVIVASYWSESENRIRVVVAYPGENGIKPDVWYEVDSNGDLIECEDAE